MKSFTLTSVALAALLKAVTADFTLYAAGIGGNGIAGNAWGYQAYNDEANCDNVIDWIWRSSSDVSGGKYGVRCSGHDGGCDSSGDPHGIDELEMNFNADEVHWTMYAARGWGLFDLNDNQVGNCSPIDDPAPEFFCGAGLGRAEGQAKVHCVTGTSGDDITGHRPS